MRLPIILISALLVLVPIPSAQACSLVRSEFYRNPEVTPLIATATADTVFAGRIFAPHVEARNSWLPVDTVNAYGQIFTAGERRIVVVYWAYDPSCLYYPIGGRWTKPGTRIVIALRERPKDKWINGLQTFDEYYGPPPRENYIEATIKATIKAKHLLTAEQYVTLYNALPTREELQQNKDKALRQLNRWLAKHPDIAQASHTIELVEFMKNMSLAPRQ